MAVIYRGVKFWEVLRLGLDVHEQDDRVMLVSMVITMDTQRRSLGEKMIFWQRQTQVLIWTGERKTSTKIFAYIVWIHSKTGVPN